MNSEETDVAEGTAVLVSIQTHEPAAKGRMKGVPEAARLA